MRVPDFLSCQFLRFCAVGVSNTTISYIIYAVLIYIGIHYILANTFGFFVSVLNAYYWNNRYVFKKGNQEKRNHIKVLMKTYITYGSSELILTSFLLYILIDYLGISEYVAQLLRLLITVPFTFLVNKFWSFK